MAGPTLKFAVALGGSAGSFKVMLRQVDRLFVPDHSSLFLVYHRGNSPGIDLAHLVPEDIAFRTQRAHEGAVVEPNVIYHPDGGRDMQVVDGRLRTRLSETLPRPSIDRLFESLAKEYGSRVIAILLSGTGRDGVAGLVEVRKRGGLSIAQDPAVARFSTLPLAAIQAGAAEHVLTTHEILTLVDQALAGRKVEL